MMNTKLFDEEIVEYSNEVKTEIGTRIQECRLMKNMTGADFGAYIGVNSNQVSRIECGVANCDLEKLYILCQCLDVSADYILFGKKENRNVNQLSEEQRKAIENLVNIFK